MAWLSGWQYRKKITISSSTAQNTWQPSTAYSIGAVVRPTTPNGFWYECKTAGTSGSSQPTWPTTDGATIADGTVTWRCKGYYQVLLKVGESSGATGYDFHLEGHSASFPSDKNQGGDLRFTKDNGSTLLDFWVESVSGTSPNRVANIWVETAGDLSQKDIYCYYGNSSATNASNPVNTLSFYDDFDRASNGLGGSWTQGAGIWQILDNHSKVVLTNLEGYAYAPPDLGNIELRVKGNLYSGVDWFGLAYRYTAETDYYRVLVTKAEGCLYLHKKVGGTWTLLGSYAFTVANNTWYNIRVNAYGSSHEIYLDDTLRIQVTDSSLSDGKVAMRAYGGTTPATVYCDDFIVRNYVSPEPAFSSAGSEEIGWIPRVIIF